MENKKLPVKSLRVTILMALFFSFSTAMAQESINTTGGNAEGSGGSVNYSIGQIVYQSYSGPDGSLAEGVQQAYEISVITAVEQAKGIELSVSVYPNPVSDYLTLNIDASTMLNIQSMSYQLYDMNGKLLQNENISGRQTIIPMDKLVAANYFVKVFAVSKNEQNGIIKANTELKTFKIIKAQ